MRQVCGSYPVILIPKAKSIDGCGVVLRSRFSGVNYHNPSGCGISQCSSMQQLSLRVVQYIVVIVTFPILQLDMVVGNVLPDRLARNSVYGGQIIYLIDIQKIAALRFPTFWFETTPQGLFMLQELNLLPSSLLWLLYHRAASGYLLWPKKLLV